MKFVRFRLAGDPENQSRTGILEGGRVVAVASGIHGFGPEADAWSHDMVALIRDFPQAQAAAEKAGRATGAGTYALDEVRLLAPMVPSTILCAGSNYHAHNREKASAPLSGKEPEFFIKTSDCVVGPDDAIVHDAVMTQKLDCETELAIVIGKAGRHIPVESALDHVFGYSIINDVTARDLQVRRKPDGTTWYELGRGKVFDSSA
ncbi:MAG: DUF2437 domain-containing protein, partial [Haliea sp.]